MKKENKIVIVLFLTAFLSVLLLYACVFDAGSGDGQQQIPVIPTENDIGKSVYIEGTVLNKKMTFKGENLIINIEGKDQTVLMIFVPKSSGAASISQKIGAGDQIGAAGIVEEYNGTLEIVLKKESDLRIFREQ
ncbi:hypothetical protein MsAg5_11160 [Methanosarcinaceae archaeon Ag5]|uniref:Uncharacterized protein n=1 Tax=Methanolapillus africanus TaxID=3028297 RepID=A0AAE4MIL9_9EURY|nr:hypothetical protein [Methanosarcinaceae archaeon Ag5]